MNFFAPVSNRTVKKYIITNFTSRKTSEIERWIVVGSDKNYLVNDNFCTCYSFILDNLKKMDTCKHIKSLEYAKSSQEFDIFTITIDEYQLFRSEWIK